MSLAPPIGFAVPTSLVFAGLPFGWPEITASLTIHLLSLIGVEVGFHRLFTHRSFEAPRVVRVTLAILGSMAFQGPVIWWAATHRRHHRFSDTKDDPHSPHLHGGGAKGFFKGLFHAHLGWLFVPSSTRSPGRDRYAKDLYKDPAIFWVLSRYYYCLFMGFALSACYVGIVRMSLEGVLLGFLWCGLVHIFIMKHHFYWCINSITHTFGTRPFNTEDCSTNNIWLAIPTLGQSWHNNHHAFPRSAMMGFQWWQLDLGVSSFVCYGAADLPTA